MLNPKEQEFVDYWSANRLRKKRGFHQLLVGLPLGMILVISILANFFSGWYKRADMQIHTVAPSMLIMLLIAGAAIIVFTGLFTARHRWDINEQYFRELTAREDTA